MSVSQLGCVCDDRSFVRYDCFHGKTGKAQDARYDDDGQADFVLRGSFLLAWHEVWQKGAKRTIWKRTSLGYEVTIRCNLASRSLGVWGPWRMEQHISIQDTTSAIVPANRIESSLAFVGMHE